MYRRWLWPALALPGVLWLVLLFIVPFYAVLGVAFGTVDPVLFQPVPIWNPLEWNVGWINEVLGRLAPGGIWFDVGVRTTPLRPHLAGPLPADRVSGRLLHGPPRGAVEGRGPHPDHPAPLDQLHDADARLGEPAAADGYVNRLPDVHPRAQPAAGLARRERVDGHLRARLRLHPVPDPAALRRRSTASTAATSRRPVTSVRARWSAFLRVTLPLSKPGILGGAVLITLPMFGDYYTPDHRLGLAEDDDDRQPDRPLLPRRPAADDRRRAHDRAAAFLVILMLYYLRRSIAPKEAGRGSAVAPCRPRARPQPSEAAASTLARLRGWLRNPWGKPRFLVVFTWLYIVWSIVPVLIAVPSPSTTAGSRTVWAGLLDPLVLGRSEWTRSCTTRPFGTLLFRASSWR